MAPSYHKFIPKNRQTNYSDYTGIVIVIDIKTLKSPPKPNDIQWLPKEIFEGLKKHCAKKKATLKANTLLTFDLNPDLRLTTLVVDGKDLQDTFGLLTLARKGFAGFSEGSASSIICYIDNSLIEHLSLVDAVVSAHYAANAYDAPRYVKDPPKKRGPCILNLVGLEDKGKETADRAAHEAAATNRVRRLAATPGNFLTPGMYVKEASKAAKACGLKTKFFNFNTLQRMGAGAFLAVAQGSEPQESGILRIDYQPKATTKASADKRLALVGKGVVFDTGGVNVKPGNSMFGMHGDMAGSAVALAVILLASQENWPINVTAFLAISDNAVSAKAYRPNDVVTSLSGLTIEVVHTDAEGRMLLADTLTLADQDKPNLIIDFATLTGTCVRALGDNYSGAFCQPEGLNEAVIAAGKKSGERLWPFPMDDDYGDCLESDVADTKQCRLSAGPDHIEAAMFLRKFVNKKTPWVHIDLAASEHEGGLAHVPTKETGFGVRSTAALVRSHFKF